MNPILRFSVFVVGLTGYSMLAWHARGGDPVVTAGYGLLLLYTLLHAVLFPRH